MRIAYMLTSLGIGGAERQALAIAERMALRGHEVLVIVLKRSEAREWSTNLRIHRLEMTRSPVALIRGGIRARRVLHSFQPDIVHSHTYPANIAARLLHVLSVAPAVVSSIHNVYEGGWHRKLAYRLTDRFAVHTTAVSEAVAKRYISSRAVAAHKCSVLTNGIDADEFALRREGVKAASPLPEAHDDFIWLAAGRDVPAKNFNNLLAAFALVRDELPRSQLWIAGQPHAVRKCQCDDHAGMWEAQGAGSVHWLGLRGDMPRVMAACDAFVLSSAWEGMPLVVGEAMAMERPVVATDVGGVRELLGHTGSLVSAKDSAALAAAMLRVMRFPSETRRAMGRAAAERIHQSFTMDRKADEWESLYRRVLGDERPRP